jgi:hypothetical protein
MKKDLFPLSINHQSTSVIIIIYLRKLTASFSPRYARANSWQVHDAGAKQNRVHVDVCLFSSDDVDHLLLAHLVPDAVLARVSAQQRSLEALFHLGRGLPVAQLFDL